MGVVMAVSDFANNAAAVAAGYVRVQTDRGVSHNPRYLTHVREADRRRAGKCGGIFKADGASNVDQATADTQALAALNAAAKHRWSGSPGRADASANSPGSKGGSMTEHVH
jgi:hypothetical protein